MSVHIKPTYARLMAAIAFSVSATALSGATVGYFQTDLTSDIPGLAAVTDPQLQNPWGMSFGLNTPFWISDQATGMSTLYSATGVKQGLVVTIPPAGVAGPTGQVFSPTRVLR